MPAFKRFTVTTDAGCTYVVNGSSLANAVCRATIHLISHQGESALIVSAKPTSARTSLHIHSSDPAATVTNIRSHLPRQEIRCH